VKVTYPRIISIQLDGEKPTRFTDASKAAEFWARAKEEEWVEKNKDNPKYKRAVVGYYRSPLAPSYQLYDDGRARYRKMKRRALKVFRHILSSDK